MRKKLKSWINRENKLETFSAEIPKLLREYIRKNNIKSEGKKYITFHTERFIKSFEWVYPLVNDKASILELGNAGAFSFLLKHFFSDIHIENITSDLRYRMPLNPAQFDLILNMEVIEHIKDRKESKITEVDFSGLNSFLLECYRVLKKGGLMFITTPNVCSYRNIFRLLDHQPPWMNTYHFREYTKNNCTAYCRNKNFSIVRAETINVWLQGELLKGGKITETIEGAEIARKIIKNENFNNKDRGDCIFIIAKK